jgi:hypothetical protein
LPLNSRGRSRVLAFRLTNDDIEIVRHLTGTASCVRLISRRSSAARSIESTTTSPSGWTHCENSASLGAPIRSLSFSRCVPMWATGPLAHAWRDGDGHAQSTVRSVNVGSYPGSARLVAAQRIGEECQVQTFPPERLPVGKTLPIRSAKTRYQISASRYGSVGTMIPTSTASQPPFKNPHGDFCYLFHQRYLIKRQVRGNVAPDECQLFPRRMTRFFITTHRKR